MLQIFNNRQLPIYRDDTTIIFAWKKESDEKEKNYLLQMDDAITTMRKITKYVKNNYNNFHFEDDGSFVGDIPQGHMVITKGYIKHMKNNHNRNFGRQMYINGQLVQEGYFLDWPVDIYIKMKSKNKKSE